MNLSIIISKYQAGRLVYSKSPADIKCREWVIYNNTALN